MTSRDLSRDVDIDSEIAITQAFLKDMEDLDAFFCATRSAGSEVTPKPAPYLCSQIETLRKFLQQLEGQVKPGPTSCPGQSGKSAIHEDGRLLLKNLALLAESEFDDHRAAQALAQGEPLPRLTAAQQALGNGLFADLRGLSREVPVGSSVGIIYGAPLQDTTSKTVECVICRDQFDVKICFHAPCSHYICRQCMNNMVDAATRDEGLLPLQCCHEQFPLEQFEQLLPQTLRVELRTKVAEVSTPTHQRLYCPNKKCSAFLGRSSGEERPPSTISCPHCKTVACSKCRAKAHARQSCEDTADREVRALAASKGWRTCPGCHRVIERNGGCNHMHCRCSTDFCYRCARRTWDCRCH